nr:molybdopterin-dependent oxidoreductase [Pseudomonadales bacterium]
MQEVRTFCRVCEPSCGLIAEVEAGEITRLKPDKEHPVTRGFACHKGIATLEIHKDEDRLNYPLKINDHGELKRISWNEAGQGIAAAIKALKEKYGEDAIASYTGNPL